MTSERIGNTVDFQYDSLDGFDYSWSKQDNEKLTGYATLIQQTVFLVARLQQMGPRKTFVPLPKH